MDNTTTDWISAIAALVGVPGAIAAFIILFLKNKAKQAHIDRLATIAEHQQVIASEMQQQTFRMKEANEILEKQLFMQQTIYLTHKVQEEESWEFLALEQISIRDEISFQINKPNKLIV